MISSRKSLQAFIIAVLGGGILHGTSPQDAVCAGVRKRCPETPRRAHREKHADRLCPHASPVHFVRIQVEDWADAEDRINATVEKVGGSFHAAECGMHIVRRLPEIRAQGGTSNSTIDERFGKRLGAWIPVSRKAQVEESFKRIGRVLSTAMVGTAAGTGAPLGEFAAELEREAVRNAAALRETPALESLIQAELQDSLPQQRALEATSGMEIYQILLIDKN